MTDFNHQLQRIQDKLIRAQRADSQLRVFGASSHKYRLKQPATLKQVLKFERAYSIQLPECYRSFVLTIGNGGVGPSNSGAGPFYGIYPFGENADELVIDNAEKYLKKDCIIYPKMADDYWKSLTRNIDESNRMPDDEFESESGKIFGGILPIGSQGCTYLHGLVLNGPYRGRVVNLDMDRQKPQFAFENNFLDWYERWLDEIISGELIKDSAGWFGYVKGGTEEELLDCFITSINAEDKEACLDGLLGKTQLKESTLNKVEHLIKHNPAHKSNLVLAKSNYLQAKPYLLELVNTDTLSAFKFIYSNSKDKSNEWLPIIEENINRINDAETLRYCTYLLKETGTQYGNLIVPFTKSSNEQIRINAYYALGQLRSKKDFTEVFIEGLNDRSNEVICTALQALSGVWNTRLLEHYKRLAEKFLQERDHILVNLEHVLKDIGLTIPAILNKAPDVLAKEIPVTKRKWYQIWK
jgi:hypothetical protein